MRHAHSIATSPIVRLLLFLTENHVLSHYSNVIQYTSKELANEMSVKQLQTSLILSYFKWYFHFRSCRRSQSHSLYFIFHFFCVFCLFCLRALCNVRCECIRLKQTGKVVRNCFYQRKMIHDDNKYSSTHQEKPVSQLNDIRVYAEKTLWEMRSSSTDRENHWQRWNGNAKLRLFLEI